MRTAYDDQLLDVLDVGCAAGLAVVPTHPDVLAVLRLAERAVTTPREESPRRSGRSPSDPGRGPVAVFVDALLPGGQRLHIVLEGISRGLSAVDIRKFVVRALRRRLSRRAVAARRGRRRAEPYGFGRHLGRSKPAARADADGSDLPGRS